MECINSAVDYSLGEALGEDIDVDATDSFPRNLRYLRIRVWIAAHQPLLSGFI